MLVFGAHLLLTWLSDAINELVEGIAHLGSSNRGRGVLEGLKID